MKDVNKHNSIFNLVNVAATEPKIINTRLYKVNSGIIRKNNNIPYSTTAIEKIECNSNMSNSI